MSNLNRLRPRSSHLILHYGQGFAISDLAGLFGTGGEGFYYRQTRFLSKMRFTIAGKEPQNVCAVAVNSRSSIAYYLAPTPAGRQADPQPDREGSKGEVVKKGIIIHMWTTPSSQGVCSALIKSLASICPACWCART
jgi:hypothetical protein